MPSHRPAIAALAAMTMTASLSVAALAVDEAEPEPEPVGVYSIEGMTWRYDLPEAPVSGA